MEIHQECALYHIQDLLQAQGLETEIITFDTKGDQILDRSLSKIGSKGERLVDIDSGDAVQSVFLVP